MLDNQIPASLYVCSCLSLFPRGPQPGLQNPSCEIFPLCSTHSLEALFDSRYNPGNWMRMSVSSTSVYHGFLISKNFLHSSLQKKKVGLWYFQDGILSPPVSGCWLQELSHSCSMSRGSSLCVAGDEQLVAVALKSSHRKYLQSLTLQVHVSRLYELFSWRTAPSRKPLSVSICSPLIFSAKFLCTSTSVGPFSLRDICLFRVFIIQNSTIASFAVHTILPSVQSLNTVAEFSGKHFRFYYALLPPL